MRNRTAKQQNEHTSSKHTQRTAGTEESSRRSTHDNVIHSNQIGRGVAATAAVPILRVLATCHLVLERIIHPRCWSNATQGVLQNEIEALDE